MVDKHINVYPPTYRGRPVTNANIQDYISNIVSKYFPIGQPPWQICVIPVMGTTLSTRVEEMPSTSSVESTSGNDTEEEQPTSSDFTMVRYFVSTEQAMLNKFYLSS